MFHFENSYKIPVSEVYGYVCKTNLPSNTAFRGFGGPQGMFLAETIIRQIAEYLNLDVVKVIFDIISYICNEIIFYFYKIDYTRLVDKH